MTDKQIRRLLGIAAKWDLFGDLYWTEDLQFDVNVNDVFFWGCSDGEYIETDEDIDALEQACRDCDAAWKGHGHYGSMLYAARRRGLRPQGAAYPPRELWDLFDEAGPERETGLRNPKPHPSKAA